MKKILGIFVLLVALASCSPTPIEIGNYQIIDTLDRKYDNFGHVYQYIIVAQLADSSLHYGNMDINGYIQYMNPKPIMSLKKIK